MRFLDHTQRRTTVGTTPLDEWSARRRDLYLTTHNTHNRQTSTPPAGFEPTISASERLQIYALDRAIPGIGITSISKFITAGKFPLLMANKLEHNKGSSVSGDPATVVQERLSISSKFIRREDKLPWCNQSVSLQEEQCKSGNVIVHTPYCMEQSPSWGANRF